jgi:hypothetical protein
MRLNAFLRLSGLLLMNAMLVVVLSTAGCVETLNYLVGSIYKVD